MSMKFNANTINSQERVWDRPEYRSLLAAKQRCYYKNHKNYSDYGGRGIKVCDRWLERGGVWAMIKDIGPKPTKNHTLERINVNGDYCPGNCRWATRKEQASNRRVRRDNKVGVTGINYDRAHDRWVARKTLKNGKRVCIGYFRKPTEAVKAIQQFGLL